MKFSIKKTVANMSLGLYFLFVLCFSLGLVIECESYTDSASSLHTSLFKNYSATVLPRCVPNLPVQVKMGIALRQILELNEPRQILQSNIWLRLEWTDCRLTWNATETGVSNLVVPYTQVWTPDISLYDNAENSLGGTRDYRATVYSDGSVYYNFPSVITSLCKVDVTYFPFDKQTCQLQFGSWSYHGLQLNLSEREAPVDISAYRENGEWEISAVPVVRHELYYGCCPEPYADVTFYIKLVRRPRFYLMNLMFPCILMSSLAVLGFLLPPDAGEKVSLEITVLLSLSVFMLIVSETMPPTSETFPFIGIYFACAMILVSWSCIVTVTVLNLHHRGSNGHRVPRLVRRVFIHRLGWLLGVRFPDQEPDGLKDSSTNLKNNTSAQNSPDGLKLADFDFKSRQLGEHVALSKNLRHNIKELNQDTRRNNPSFAEDRPSKELEVLQEQCVHLHGILELLQKKKESNEIAGEWQLLAQVLDRTCMILFVLFQLITTSVLMAKISSGSQ